MDWVAICKELAEVTPVGNQDGKEQRPAAIKSQPVPATTLRESHSPLQEKQTKEPTYMMPGKQVHITLTWGTVCWWFSVTSILNIGPNCKKCAKSTMRTTQNHRSAEVKLKAVQRGPRVRWVRWPLVLCCQADPPGRWPRSILPLASGGHIYNALMVIVIVGIFGSKWSGSKLKVSYFIWWTFRNLLNAMVFFSLVLFLYLFLGWHLLHSTWKQTFLWISPNKNPLRLCDISLANCTNALAIDSEVASWLGVFCILTAIAAMPCNLGHFAILRCLRVGAWIFPIDLHSFIMPSWNVEKLRS